MSLDTSTLSYSDFLAFLMIYGAGMDNTLSDEELEYIRKKTGIQDIDRIKNSINSISDAEALEIIDDYKTRYLSTEESKAKARHDLEELLKTPGEHSQLEKVVVHLIEKLI